MSMRMPRALSSPTGFGPRTTTVDAARRSCNSALRLAASVAANSAARSHAGLEDANFERLHSPLRQQRLHRLRIDIRHFFQSRREQRRAAPSDDHFRQMGAGASFQDCNDFRFHAACILSTIIRECRLAQGAVGCRNCILACGASVRALLCAALLSAAHLSAQPTTGQPAAENNAGPRRIPGSNAAHPSAPAGHSGFPCAGTVRHS